MIFSKAIPEIEKAIGYKFKDKSLLTQAFTRTSFCNEAGKAGNGGEYQSNEVLEFLGDSVLSTAIITKLLSDKGMRYSHGLKTELNEGDFSNIKSNLSDKTNLSQSIRLLGLQKYLIMGRGDSKLEIENEPSVMEDLFESIVGAIYLDCGMEVSAVMRSVVRMLDISSYINGDAVNGSAKNALQEWCEDKKRRLPKPRYETESEHGPDHKKIFVRVCYVGDKIVGRGEGKNQKTADAAAAKAALKALTEAEEKTKNTSKSTNKQNIKPAAKEKTKKAVKEQLYSSQSEMPINLNAPSELRSYAAKKHLPSPEFRDLGETEESTQSRRVYRIECRLDNKVATGDAMSKSDARATAASNLLKMLATTEIKSKKAATKAPKQKPAKTESSAKNSAVKKFTSAKRSNKSSK